MFQSGLAIRKFYIRIARTNIYYSVYTINSNQREHDNIVVQVVEAKFYQYELGKIIVYYNSTTSVSKYVDILGVNIYYSDANLKAKKFEDFYSRYT